MMIVIYIIPLVICAVIAILYVIIHIISGKKSVAESINGFQLALMIALSLVHPFLFQQFTCDDVAGERYLRVDYSVRCDGAEYQRFVGASAAFLIIYIFGAMTLLFHRQYHNASSGKLFESSSSSNGKYAFFVQGYTQESYFWEGVVMARKMLIVLFAATVNSLLQIFISFGILLLSWFGTIHFTPFRSTPVNRLESLALVALVVTALLGAISLSTDDSSRPGTTTVLFLVNLSVTAFLIWNIVQRLLGMANTPKSGATEMSSL